MFQWLCWRRRWRRRRRRRRRRQLGFSLLDDAVGRFASILSLSLFLSLFKNVICWSLVIGGWWLSKKLMCLSSMSWLIRLASLTSSYYVSALKFQFPPIGVGLEADENVQGPNSSHSTVSFPQLMNHRMCLVAGHFALTWTKPSSWRLSLHSSGGGFVGIRWDSLGMLGLLRIYHESTKECLDLLKQ